MPVDVAARLADTARAANRRLAERIREDPALAGMGTTLTVLANDGERLALLHVGDSRLYRRRGGELVQLTRDQTAVQDLVDAGLLAPGDIRTHPLRSVLNQAIDGRDDVALQPSWPDLRAGDRVLLCSDGVSDYVEQAELAACLGLPERWEAAVELTRAAIRAGSTDNITAVVADLVDGEPPAQRPICFGPTA